MTKITIQQLSLQDVEDFRKIRLSALKNAPEMFGSTYAVEVTRPLSVFAEVISKYVILAAYSQQHIIGMLILDLENHLTTQPQAQLYGFYVEPSHRKQGIAVQILQTAIQHAQPYVEKITLSVRASNIPAIHLYQKLGFHIDIHTENNDDYEIKMVFFY